MISKILTSNDVKSHDCHMIVTCMQAIVDCITLVIVNRCSTGYSSLFGKKRAYFYFKAWWVHASFLSFWIMPWYTMLTINARNSINIQYCMLQVEVHMKRKSLCFTLKHSRKYFDFHNIKTRLIVSRLFLIIKIMYISTVNCYLHLS